MKKNSIRIINLIFASLFLVKANAQENKQTAFSFHYNYQIPIGILTETYGNNSSIGAAYLLERTNNIIFGIEANYIFGNNIKDQDIFNNISTSTGAIINGNGQYGNVILMQRGFDAYFFTGYALHVQENNLSGLYLSQGIGYLQHQIFIDTKNQNIPQLNEDMKAGYDRLTSGLSSKSSIDYKYYHKKGRFQMGIGINYTVAYTKNQRTYNFANNQYYPQENSWDKLFGIKVEIIIPINRRNNEEFHYF